MIWIEALGYIAAACTLATYSMKTMIPLRISGIIANCFFIAFGFFGAIYPTLILHVILLPLNAVRLYQMLQLVRRVREASEGDLSMDWLKPFMTRRRWHQGDILFSKGDVADTLFYIVSGRFHLNEIDIDVGHGQLIGDSGFWRPPIVGRKPANAWRRARRWSSATMASSNCSSRTRSSAFISCGW
jgi:CRP/FNR family transcriptional regulator, cyclic AMP receptor protein